MSGCHMHTCKVCGCGVLCNTVGVKCLQSSVHMCHGAMASEHTEPAWNFDDLPGDNTP
jgi:hypothetical protein